MEGKIQALSNQLEDFKASASPVPANPDTALREELGKVQWSCQRFSDENSQLRRHVSDVSVENQRLSEAVAALEAELASLRSMDQRNRLVIENLKSEASFACETIQKLESALQVRKVAQ
jgi:chromosome segregation ATPase